MSPAIAEIGPPGGTLVAGTLASMAQHRMPHEIWLLRN